MESLGEGAARGRALVACAALMLTALFACQRSGDRDADGGGGPSESSGRSPTAADFIELGQASCGLFERCCQEMGMSARAAQCSAPENQDVDLSALMTRDTLKVNEAVLRECLAMLRSSTCRGLQTDTCARAFEGTVAPGGACVSPSECADLGGPKHCVRFDSRPAEQPGVCVIFTEGAIGDACATSSAPNGGGTINTFQTAAQQPTAYCNVDDGLYCARPESVCRQRAGEGATCDSDQTFACQPGLYCDRASSPSTCKPQKPAGSACTDSRECQLTDYLCKEGTCVELTYESAGICEAVQP